MRMIQALLRDLIGPAAVMAAGTMGAGAMASFLLAGAWFGYDLLWVILLMLPVFVVSADSASRIGALNPRRGMMSLVRDEVSPILAWLILVIVVPVHFLVSMGQVSVMTSAFSALAFGSSPPEQASAAITQSAVGVGLSALILGLILSRGYERMQRIMTGLMVLMFVCFLLVALRGLAEWPSILRGFTPSIPADLPVPRSDEARSATTSVIAMIGAAIAPAALLGLPYLCSDNGATRDNLDRDFRQAIINLGLVFGAYAILVVVAGAYALHALPDHASFADVGAASQVFAKVLPGTLAPLGPMVFNLGLFIAAMTTLIVAAQVTVYFLLDMLKRPWRFTRDNRAYRLVISGFIFGAALLAPLWDFPALLKVILLMGINVVVIPLVYVILLFLANRRSVMQDVPTPWWRNALLGVGLAASTVLAIDKAPGYAALLLN